jgi:exonuclease SbcC
VIPISLQLSNFLSYGVSQAPLDFTQFHTACLSGNNGNGKSALLDAITWSLWGEARHTTSALLRLGESDMRTEFVFDLDGERYRVTRGYAKNKRSSASLELNVLDATSGLYRPITRASVRETQSQINGMLRMDYETFLSSAYLKQGQADKFSRQPPAQRKQVLAEILGLARYQEIAERARADARGLDGQVQALDAQIEGIERFLAGRTEAQDRYGELTRLLETLHPEVERLQGVVEEQTTRKIRLEERRKRAETIRVEVADAERKRVELQSARGRILAQQAEVEEWKLQSEAIAADMEAYGAAKNTLEKWDAVAEKWQFLKDEHARLKEKIDLAAATLNRRSSELEAQIAHEHRLLEENNAKIAQSTEIAEGARRLEAARAEETSLVSKRAEHDQAERSLREAEDALRAKRQNLDVQLQSIDRQRNELAQQSGRLEELQEQVANIESQLALLDEANARINELQEEKIGYDARLAQLKQHVEAEKTSIASSEQKLKVLLANPQAQCPLCKSGLGDHGREHIQESIEDDIANAQSRIEEYTAEGRLIQKKRTALEGPLNEIQTQLRNAPRLNAEAASLRHARDAAAEAGRKARELTAERETLNNLLASGDYAPELVTVVTQRKTTLTAIDYDRTDHEAASTLVAELAHFERDIAALNFAKQQAAAAQERLAILEPEYQQVKEELASGSYASEDVQELARVRAQGEQLGYDKDARALHRAAKAEFDRLQTAPRRWDKLQHILAGAERIATELAANARAATEIDATISRLSEETAALGDILLKIAACERSLVAAQQELREARDNERSMRTELGHQSAILEQCAQREAERVQLAADYKNKAHESFILRQTAQAFGKDGIQALIIENAIPEIQDDANQILRRLTRNHMQISLESQREKQTGGLRETLDIKISDDKGTREYLMFSGGEAFRADFALRIALSKLLARRAGTQLRTLIIDEGFGTQDSEGLQQMIECIQAIADDFSKVLVVTHLDTIKNAFPTRIEVIKEPDTGSRYEVLTA